MKSRDELIKNLETSLKRAKTFSCPEFKNIYSKAYFKEIVKPTLKTPKNTYSFLFGDFNKLGVINDIYGHDFGDGVLEYSMRIIKKSLPKEATIVRAGGDEIYIIIPNSDKTIADKYAKLINNNLQKNAVLIGGLSIELASTDSTYGDIDNLISITDNEVTTVKAARKKTNSPADILSDDFINLNTPADASDKEKEAWDELNLLTNTSIYNFLQNFRPTKNFAFSSKQIIDSSDFVTDSFIYLLREKLNGDIPNKLLSVIKKDYPYKPESVKNDIPVDNSTNFDKDTIFLIHNLVDTSPANINLDNFSDSELEYITNSLDVLLESLVRDHTGLLDKQYFRHALAEEICNFDEEYSASYCTFPGLKLSNAAYDHTFSDIRLEKTNSILCNESEKELNYNNNSFDFTSGSTYLLSQSGGNYLYLYPKKYSDIVRSKIEDIMNTINSTTDSKDPNSHFNVSYYSMSDDQMLPTSNPKKLIKYIRALKEEANFKKVEFKKDLFNSADAYFAFKKSINNCVDFYLDNISDGSEDISKLTLFMQNIYTSFLNQTVLHNETRNSKKHFGLGINDDFEK